MVCILQGVRPWQFAHDEPPPMFTLSLIFPWNEWQNQPNSETCFLGLTIYIRKRKKKIPISLFFFFFAGEITKRSSSIKCPVLNCIRKSQIFNEKDNLSDLIITWLSFFRSEFYKLHYFFDLKLFLCPERLHFFETNKVFGCQEKGRWI